MENLSLSDSEYRLMDIIWDHAPVESGKIVQLCKEKFDWKKSTTYTMLKKLIIKGMVQNENAVVTVLVERGTVQQAESSRIVTRNFGGSLPSFITAFLGDRTLSDSEAGELLELIDRYRGEH